MSQCPFNPGQVVWTDYPFEALGLPAGVRAPFFAVTFLSYDADKYATVRLATGQEADVKIGYLHAKNPDDAPRFCLSGTTDAPHGSLRAETTGGVSVRTSEGWALLKPPPALTCAIPTPGATLAERLYCAYNRDYAMPGTTPWADLPANAGVRARWDAVAREAETAVWGEPEAPPLVAGGIYLYRCVACGTRLFVAGEDYPQLIGAGAATAYIQRRGWALVVDGVRCPACAVLAVAAKERDGQNAARLEQT